MQSSLTAYKVRDLPMLTGARFVAAVAVMFCHFGPRAGWPTALTGHGREAVAFFFVLSGFVLTYNYAGRYPDAEPGAWLRFMQARFARIFPVHLIVLVLSTLMLWYVCRRDPSQGPGTSVGAGVVSWLENLLLVQSYTLNRTAIGYWSGPAWSISCEATFYLAFPFILVRLRRLPSPLAIARAALGVWAAALALLLALAVLAKYPLRTYASDIELIVYHAPYLRIAEFMMGCLAGLWFIRRGPTPWPHRLSREAAAWGGLAVAVTIAMLADYGKISMVVCESAVFALPFAVMILAISSGPTTLGACLSGRLLGRLGEASFSLYLLHAIPYVFLTRLNGQTASTTVVVATMSGCVLTSLGLFYAVEDPCRRWLRRTPIARTQPVTVPVVGMAASASLLPTVVA